MCHEYYVKLKKIINLCNNLFSADATEDQENYSVIKGKTFKNTSTLTEIFITEKSYPCTTSGLKNTSQQSHAHNPVMTATDLIPRKTFKTVTASPDRQMETKQPVLHKGRIRICLHVHCFKGFYYT